MPTACTALIDWSNTIAAPTDTAITVDHIRNVAAFPLAIPLMADWIDQQQDVEVVRRRAMAEAEEEGG